MDSEITEFQLYPSPNGHTFNASGNRADQVIVYGKIKTGMISEGNVVEVYGQRDADNTIVSKQVKNVTTGAVVHPSLALSRNAVIATTLGVLAAVVILLLAWGPGFFVGAGLIVLLVLLLPYLVRFAMYVSVFGLIRALTRALNR